MRKIPMYVLGIPLHTKNIPRKRNTISSKYLTSRNSVHLHTHHSQPLPFYRDYTEVPSVGTIQKDINISLHLD